MKLLTREWVKKAEGDFACAQRELRARKAPSYDASCFHAQQCAEKYLKALLQEQGTPFGKTHDLAILADLLIPIVPSLKPLRDDLKKLTAYAVEFRYPGASADKTIASEACRMSERIRGVARLQLGVRGRSSPRSLPC